MAWCPLRGFFIQAKGMRWRLMDSTGVLLFGGGLQWGGNGQCRGEWQCGGGDHLGYRGNDCRGGTERRQGGTAGLEARFGLVLFISWFCSTGSFYQALQAGMLFQVNQFRFCPGI